MNIKNTNLEDEIAEAEGDVEDLRYDCDSCRAETPHTLVAERYSDAGPNLMYIDTEIRCNDCGFAHEVTERGFKTQIESE